MVVDHDLHGFSYKLLRVQLGDSLQARPIWVWDAHEQLSSKLENDSMIALAEKVAQLSGSSVSAYFFIIVAAMRLPTIFTHKTKSSCCFLEGQEL